MIRVLKTSDGISRKSLENEKENLPNTFVDDNADGVLGDVENASGLSVIEFVRHTFLEGAISLKLTKRSIFFKKIIRN